MRILTLGKQEGAFANLRGWRGTGGDRARLCRGRGSGESSWMSSVGWAGKERQGRGRPWEAQVAAERVACNDGVGRRGDTGTA